MLNEKITWADSNITKVSGDNSEETRRDSFSFFIDEITPRRSMRKKGRFFGSIFLESVMLFNISFFTSKPLISFNELTQLPLLTNTRSFFELSTVGKESDLTALVKAT